MDIPGLEEALSGGMGASVNYLSLIPFDGVSSGMGVLSYIGLRWQL